MDKNEYIKEYSEKFSVPAETMNTDFDELLKNEKEIHANLSESDQERRAFHRLALMYRKRQNSPAVGFEGMIIGVGDCVDIVAGAKRKAIALFNQDPQTAVNEGITDENGVPLDARREWSTGRENRGFGKPLPENNFMRNIFGVASKSGKEETPKFFSMTINGPAAENEDITIFKPVRFMAIDKSQEGDTEYKLNASQFTKVVVDEKIQLPPVKTVIDTYCKNHIVAMANLETYHTTEVTNFNRLVIVEGDVSSLNLQPTAFGSRIMSLEDMSSLEDLDSHGTTCWIPSQCEIDFAEGSKVLVIGRTAQGKKKDDDGKQTEELGDVSINVFGLYAIPEFKIDLQEEIKEITEESLTTE